MITIVSAFYDIGRTEWKDFSRSTDVYFKAFETMCLLENDIILFTEEKFKDRISKITSTIKKNITVHYLPIFENNIELLEKISAVQNSETFKLGITNPSCPEYIEPKYILVNHLKSFFCLEALKLNTQITGTIAWIDFGYCRKTRFLPTTRQWDYNFDETIHLFNLLDIHDQIDITKTIKTNTVYIQGCHIVANQHGWQRLNTLMNESLNTLLEQNLVDDDQTLLLMSFLKSKKDFTLHKATISKKFGWFFIFKHFNFPKNNRSFFLNKLFAIFNKA